MSSRTDELYIIGCGRSGKQPAQDVPASSFDKSGGDFRKKS